MVLAAVAVLVIVVGDGALLGDGRLIGFATIHAAARHGHAALLTSTASAILSVPGRRCR